MNETVAVQRSHQSENGTGNSSAFNCPWIDHVTSVWLNCLPVKRYQLLFTEHILSARNSFKLLTNVDSVNAHNSTMGRMLLLISLYRWGDWGWHRKLSNFVARACFIKSISSSVSWAHIFPSFFTIRLRPCGWLLTNIICTEKMQAISRPGS